MNMFRELLEAVIKCMIILQELNFDPMKEILKIWCHNYILIKKVIILRKICVKIKSFAPPWKETKHMPQLLIYYIQHENIENLNLSKCQKQQPLEVFCKKRCSLKCRKINKKILCQKETPVKRAPLLQSNSGDCFWNVGISITKREI